MGDPGPNAGKPAYTPPRGKGVVEAKLDNLIEFLNDGQSQPDDVLLKKCIAHYQFEVIHPFRDGNGRAENTSRNYLNELADLQVLEKKMIKGKHYYINPALVEILSY